jgi:hypothetical protein
MRSVYEIQKEIAAASHKLNNLILEKKLTLQVMWGYEQQAKEIAERAIAKMKEMND